MIGRAATTGLISNGIGGWRLPFELIRSTLQALALRGPLPGGHSCPRTPWDRFAADLYGAFPVKRLLFVWGFSCQAVVIGFCS
jgi:hypothetical protein